LIKALEFSAIEAEVNLKLVWIDSEHFEKDHTEEYKIALSNMLECKGVLVPGGFGYRGTEGKIVAIRIVREKNIPFFGICLGF
jgi:CTP synthase